uniref:SCA7 domain-containing protein n=1 Tax=Clastoptera arizonana TaxID=38151 RepID=A0A1B6C0W8_9HEMI
MTSRSVSPSMYHGLPWETWTNVLGRTSPQDDDKDLDAKQVPKPAPVSSVMKLPKEDMRLFGVCPEREPFSVVVCELCNLSVTPQGLLNHIELRHTKVPEPTVDVSPPAPIEVDKLPSKQIKLTTKIKSKKTIIKDINRKKSIYATTNGIPMRLPLSVPIECPVNPSKDSVTISPPTLKDEFQPSVTLTPISSPLSQPDKSPAPPPPVYLCTSTNGIITKVPKPQRIRDRKCVPIKEREYDPDKHCGVAVSATGETVKPCTRSLTCKSHSMSLRRAVTGRSKSFDQLLSDHRQAKDAILRQKKLMDSQNTALQPKNSVSILVTNQDKEKPKDLLFFTPITVSSPLQPPPPPPTATTTAATTSLFSGGAFRAIHEMNAQEVHIHVPISVALLSPISIPSPGLPDLTVDVMAEKKVPLGSSPKSYVLKTQFFENLSAFTMFNSRKVPPHLDIPLTNSHPKSLSVCRFSSHKIGGLIYAKRRMQVPRQGLEEALHQ